MSVQDIKSPSHGHPFREIERMNNDVKIGVIIATVLIALFVAIAGGINLNDYLHERTAQKCIAMGKIYAEKACVDNIQDLRYIKD
jgi:hypothetical protein